MIVIPWGVEFAMRMPTTVTSDDPLVFHVLRLIMFLGIIRATVLWFQTLVHGVRDAKEENPYLVVLGHVLLGQIMAYLYYYGHRAGGRSEHPSDPA